MDPGAMVRRYAARWVSLYLAAAAVQRVGSQAAALQRAVWPLAAVRQYAAALVGPSPDAAAQELRGTRVLRVAPLPEVRLGGPSLEVRLGGPWPAVVPSAGQPARRRRLGLFVLGRMNRCSA
jgi:hypothetical protein